VADAVVDSEVGSDATAEIKIIVIYLWNAWLVGFFGVVRSEELGSVLVLHFHFNVSEKRTGLFRRVCGVDGNVGRTLDVFSLAGSCCKFLQ